jgi:hypothetical protein
MNINGACNSIQQHYQPVWQSTPTRHRLGTGPIHELPTDFAVLEFPPPPRHAMWIYATCGLSSSRQDDAVELHLFSPSQTAEHIELLTAIAHYHATASPLGVGHLVNFGRPWMPGSHCDRGLISLPYVDGPTLEKVHIAGRDVRCLWLIPITNSEREFAKAHGLNALETEFEKAHFNYVDPLRPPVV